MLLLVPYYLTSTSCSYFTSTSCPYHYIFLLVWNLVVDLVPPRCKGQEEAFDTIASKIKELGGGHVGYFNVIRYSFLLLDIEID